MQELNELTLDSHLSTLTNAADGRCVSICIPTHTSGAETRQDPLQLRTALDEAEEKLQERGVRSPDIETLLKPAREIAQLNENTDFWRHQRRSLALFLSPNRALYRRLPYEMNVRVDVDQLFNVRPLLPLLTRDLDYYLIALSQRDIRLYEGGPDELREIDTSGWPDEIRELEAFIDAEKSLQHHSSGGPTGDAGQRAAIHHGHGADRDQHKTRIFEFFRRLDEHLKEALQDHKRPLIPIGVERVVKIFREATSYPTLSEHSAEGNPDHMKEDELLERVQSAIKPHLERRRRTGLERFEKAAGSERACRDVEKIVLAAADGLVESLLLAESERVYGVYNANQRSVAVHDEPTTENRDLLNLSAVQTLRNSGFVYVYDREEMPDQQPVAAVLRAGAEAVV